MEKHPGNFPLQTEPPFFLPSAWKFQLVEAQVLTLAARLELAIAVAHNTTLPTGDWWEDQELLDAIRQTGNVSFPGHES